MKNIIQSSLFSFFLHGIILTCCFAFPAQKLVPLFCAGDSALTLTSLSICQPGAVSEDNSLTLHEQRRKADQHASEGIEAEIEENEEDDADLAIESGGRQEDKQPAAASRGNVKNPDHPVEGKKPALFLNGDNRTKGIAGAFGANSGIHPYYPLGARLRGEEGIVSVEARLGGDGGVLDCAVIKSSGFPALDDAAVASVKRARFVTASGLAPAKDSKTVLTFRFDLTD